MSIPPLPTGWEEKIDASGRLFYIDHIRRLTQWERPNSLTDTFQQSVESQTVYDPHKNIWQSQGSQTAVVQEKNQSSEGVSDGSNSTKMKTRNITSSNAELQSLAMEILPYKIPDKDRLNCFKCQVKFQPPFQKRHHCRSCGDIYCNDCSNHRLHVILPSHEYKEPVRVCDYCMGHLSARDANCMLRYMGILNVRGNNIVEKLQAARALHMSIEAEKLFIIDDQSCKDRVLTETHEQWQDEWQVTHYPGLWALKSQLGGYSQLWCSVLNILSRQYPPELHDLGSRIASSIFQRSLSTVALQSFVDLDGFPHLVAALSDSSSVASAAEALLQAVVLDKNALGQRNPLYVSTTELGHQRRPSATGAALATAAAGRAGIMGSVFPLSAILLLPNLMDALASSPPPVQNQLCDVLTHVVKLDEAGESTKQLIDDGILILATSFLQATETSTRAAALRLTSTVLKTYAHSLTCVTTFLNRAMTSLLDNRIVCDIDTNFIVPIPDFVTTDVSVLALLDQISSSQSHPSLVIGSENEFAFIQMGVTADVAGPSAASPAASILTKTVSLLGQSIPHSASENPSIDRLVYTSLRVCYNLVFSSSVPATIMNAIPLVESVLQIACISLSTRTVLQAISVLLQFAYLPEMAAKLMKTGLLERLIEVVAGSATTVAMDSIVNGQRNPRREIDGVAAVGSHCEFENNPAVDLLTFLLYHVQSATGLRSFLQGLNAPDTNATVALLAATLNPPPMVQWSVVNNSAIWDTLYHYLQCASNMAASAARLILVVGSSHDEHILCSVMSEVNSRGIVQLLIDLACDESASDTLVEAAIGALGSLAGAPGLYAWETVILSKRSSAPRHQLSPHDSLLYRYAKYRANMPSMPEWRILILPDTFSPETPLRGLREGQELVRQICIAQSPALLIPVVGGQTKGLLALVSALRLLQVVERVGTCGHEWATDPSYLNFVEVFHMLDDIAVIIALDVFGSLTRVSTVSVSAATKIQAGLGFICRTISTAGSGVRSKMLNTVAACTMNPKVLAAISLSFFPAITNCLQLESHLHDATVDSEFVLHRALAILKQLLSQDEWAHSLVCNEAFISNLYTLIFAGNNLVTSQRFDPTYLLWPHFAGSSNLRLLGLDCLKALSAHSRYRSILLASNLPALAIDVCAQTLAHAASITLDTNPSSLFPYIMALHPKDYEQQQQQQQGRQPGLTSTVSIDFMESDQDGESAKTQYEKDAQIIMSAIEADASSAVALDILYNLCTERHASIRHALLRQPLSCVYLCMAWASSVKLREKAVTVLLRSGVDVDFMDAGSDAATQHISTSLPWCMLVDTDQLHILLDMLRPPPASSPMPVLEEFSNLQARSLVCECIRTIISLSHADAVSAANALTQPLESDMLSFSPALTPKTRVNSLDVVLKQLSGDFVRTLIVHHCASSTLLTTIEYLSPQSLPAATLLSTIFNWSEVNFRYTSSNILQTEMQLLQSNDGNIRRIAVKILLSAIQHSKESQYFVLSQLPRKTVSSILEEVIMECLSKLNGNLSNLDCIEDGTDEQLEEHITAETLVATLVVITAFFSQNSLLQELQDRGQCASSACSVVDSVNDFLLADEEVQALSVATTGLLELIQAKSAPLSTAAVRMSVPVAGERGVRGSTGTSSPLTLPAARTGTTQSLWASLEKLSAVKSCAQVLLATNTLKVLSDYMRVPPSAHQHQSPCTSLSPENSSVIMTSMNVLLNLCRYFEGSVAEQLLVLRQSSLSHVGAPPDAIESLLSWSSLQQDTTIETVDALFLVTGTTTAIAPLSTLINPPSSTSAAASSTSFSTSTTSSGVTTAFSLADKALTLLTILTGTNLQLCASLGSSPQLDDWIYRQCQTGRGWLLSYGRTGLDKGKSFNPATVRVFEKQLMLMINISRSDVGLAHLSKVHHTWILLADFLSEFNLSSLLHPPPSSTVPSILYALGILSVVAGSLFSHSHHVTEALSASASASTSASAQRPRAPKAKDAAVAMTHILWACLSVAVNSVYINVVEKALSLASTLAQHPALTALLDTPDAKRSIVYIMQRLSPVQAAAAEAAEAAAEAHSSHRGQLVDSPAMSLYAQACDKCLRIIQRLLILQPRHFAPITSSTPLVSSSSFSLASSSSSSSMTSSASTPDYISSASNFSSMPLFSAESVSASTSSSGSNGRKGGDTGVNVSLEEDLVDSILMIYSSPRTMTWLPVLFRAVEIVGILVLHPPVASIILRSQHRQSDSSIPPFSAESSVLADMLRENEHRLNPKAVPALRPQSESGQRPGNVHSIFPTSTHVPTAGPATVCPVPGKAPPMISSRPPLVVPTAHEFGGVTRMATTVGAGANTQSLAVKEASTTTTTGASFRRIYSNFEFVEQSAIDAKSTEAAVAIERVTASTTRPTSTLFPSASISVPSAEDWLSELEQKNDAKDS